VATLIQGRDQKIRPTDFGMNQVFQPFDSGEFNFTKVMPEEVIFSFCEADKKLYPESGFVFKSSARLGDSWMRFHLSKSSAHKNNRQSLSSACMD
jgi:hypothetical protein